MAGMGGIARVICDVVYRPRETRPICYSYPQVHGLHNNFNLLRIISRTL